MNIQTDAAQCSGVVGDLLLAPASTCYRCLVKTKDGLLSQVLGIAKNTTQN
jgi:hypothetical protein